MSEVFVDSAGLAAPGIPDWSAALAILRGEAPYQRQELPPYQPKLLPPNERRRATPAVRQAFRAAEDAVLRSTRPAAELATVFASSDADMGIIHRICLALCESTRSVSPTDFHNSVHNAASGYWSIATAARGPSTSVCAHDASVAAALLESAAMVLSEGRDVLLVAYDVPPPAPLYAERPIDSAVSAALVLSAEPAANGLGRLRLHPDAAAAPTAMACPQLEALRRSNPAARALPLLRLLARGEAGLVWLESGGGASLGVEVLR